MVTWRASPLLVVALVGSAAANPPEMCKPAGAVVLEVDQLADAPAKLATATTWLYENGSWKREVYDAHHKLVRWSTGCTGTAELDTFNAGVRDALWKVTRTVHVCQTDRTRSRVYRWKGRVLYTERTCSVDDLDPHSRELVDSFDRKTRAENRERSDGAAWRGSRSVLGRDRGAAAPVCPPRRGAPQAPVARRLSAWSHTVGASARARVLRGARAPHDRPAAA